MACGPSAPNPAAVTVELISTMRTASMRAFARTQTGGAARSSPSSARILLGRRYSASASLAGLDIKTSIVVCIDDENHLTLDDDVAATLERLRRSHRISLKRLIDEALRRGLDDMGRRRRPREVIVPERWRLVTCGSPASTILAKRSPLPKAKASSDTDRCQYPYLRPCGSFAQHNVARDWLDQQLNAFTLVGLPWPSVLAFLRLVTNPRVFEHLNDPRCLAASAHLA